MAFGTPIVSVQDGPRMSGKLSNFGGHKATPFGKGGVKRKRARALLALKKARAADLSYYQGDDIDLAKLSAAKRKSLPSSAFVFPKTREFPIHDIHHARAALANAHHAPSPALVRAKVLKKYPELRSGK
jgi:hypothetical protein